MRAEQALLQAEKFWAQVEPPPPGNFDKLAMDVDASIEQNRNSLNILNIGSGVSDDDFFHLTCHIDPNLIHKIEKRGIHRVGEAVTEGEVGFQR